MKIKIKAFHNTPPRLLYETEVEAELPYAHEPLVHKAMADAVDAAHLAHPEIPMTELSAAASDAEGETLNQHTGTLDDAEAEALTRLLFRLAQEPRTEEWQALGLLLGRVSTATQREQCRKIFDEYHKQKGETHEPTRT